MINRSPNLFGVMHLGSETVSLQIVEYISVGNMKIVEKVSSQMALGEETFKKGKICFPTVREVCELLKGYRRILCEYGVRDYRLFATTAIREAENQQYIVDQIRVKTGFSVEVVDVPEEIFYKYIALFRSIESHGFNDEQDGILFVDISSGGLGVTLYEAGALLFQQNIHIGALRIKESFNKSQRESAHFYQVLSEYINSTIEPLKSELSSRVIKYLVVSGVETHMLLKMLGRSDSQKLTVVSIGDFIALYEQVKVLNLPQLMQKFALSEQRAEVVLPTLLLYHQIMEISKVTDIVISNAQFSEGIMISHIGEKVGDKWIQVIEAQIVSLAQALGRKYNYDPKHAGSVENISLALFDKLAKVHGLGRRERFLLKIAAILHDIGKYVSLRTHYFYSYRLIIASDLIGFSEQERELVANVAYYHSKGTPSSTDTNFAVLSPPQKMTMAKLAAIIRLADALDRGHLQKVSIHNISLVGDEFIVTVTVTADQDISLEEWTFEDKTNFFERVFGIKAILQLQTG